MTALSLYPWTLDVPSFRTIRNTQKARPFTNISKNDVGYTVEIAVPGFKKDEIEVKIDKNKLSIMGIIETSQDASTEQILKKEFGKSEFSVEYTLAETIDQENIEAEVVDGILKVSLPFKAEVKKEAITVTIK